MQRKRNAAKRLCLCARQRVRARGSKAHLEEADIVTRWFEPATVEIVDSVQIDINNATTMEKAWKLANFTPIEIKLMKAPNGKYH